MNQGIDAKKEQERDSNGGTRMTVGVQTDEIPLLSEVEIAALTNTMIPITGINADGPNRGVLYYEASNKVLQ